MITLAASTTQHPDLRTVKERGSATFEFALSISIFLAALIFFVDMVQIAFKLETAQFVAWQSLRSAIVTTGKDPAIQEQYAVLRAPASCEDRLQAIKASAVTLARNVGLAQISAENVFVCPLGGRCLADDPGRGRGFIQVEVEVPLKLFLLNWDFTVRARAAGRNEAYVSCV